jgi:hypothetical protein
MYEQSSQAVNSFIAGDHNKCVLSGGVGVRVHSSFWSVTHAGVTCNTCVHSSGADRASKCTESIRARSHARVRRESTTPPHTSPSCSRCIVKSRQVKSSFYLVVKSLYFPLLDFSSPTRRRHLRLLRPKHRSFLCHDAARISSCRCGRDGIGS